MLKNFMELVNALTASDIELPILTQDIEELEAVKVFLIRFCFKHHPVKRWE